MKNYTIQASALQVAGLRAATAAANRRASEQAAVNGQPVPESLTPADYLQSRLAQMLRDYAGANDELLLGEAISRYPFLDDTARSQILTLLGLSYLQGLDVPSQTAALAGLGLAAFRALDVPTQEAVAGLLGLDAGG